MTRCLLLGAALYAVCPGISLAADELENPKLPEGVHVLGEFTNRLQISNKYVLVPRDLSRERLVDVAERLHAAYPNCQFWMLETSDGVPELVGKLQQYDRGQIERSELPLDLIRRHMVANLQKYLSGNWYLHEGAGVTQIARIGTRVE